MGRQPLVLVLIRCGIALLWLVVFLFHSWWAVCGAGVLTLAVATDAYNLAWWSRGWKVRSGSVASEAQGSEEDG
jgi:hypothetical protein